MKENLPNSPPEIGENEGRPALLNGREVTVKGDYFEEKGVEYILLADGSKVLADDIDEIGKVKDTVEGTDSTDTERKKIEEVAEELGEAAVEATVEPEISEDDETAHPVEDEDQEQKAKLKPKYKFHRRQSVVVELRSGKKVERIVKASFVGKEGKVIVVVRDPEGKVRNWRIPEEVLEKSNPKTKEGEPPKDDSPDWDDNNGDNGDDNPEAANHPDDSPWLDPRWVEELKDNFEHKYKFMLNEEQDRRKRLNDDSPIPEEFRNIVKTHVIESAIRNSRDRAQWLAGEGRLGSEEEGHKRWPGFTPIDKWEIVPPSEQIKRQIAAMMDKSGDELREMAESVDNELKNQRQKFKPGQEVKIVNADGSIVEGTVKGYQYNVKGSGVLVNYGKEVRRYGENKLREMQEQTNPDSDKIVLDSLKDYINNPDKATIRTDDGFVEGQFQGLKISNKNIKNVYFGDKEGKRIGEVAARDFLSWQEQKTEEQKLRELEDQLKPYIGLKFSSTNSEGKSETMEVRYNSDEKKVQVVSGEDVKNEYSIEEFLANHAATIVKLDRIDREIPRKDRKFTLGQKVKGKSDGKLEEGWIVDDFSNQADGKIWVTIKKDAVEKKVEQDELEQWQNSNDNQQEEENGPKSGGNAPTAGEPEQNKPKKERKSWYEKAKERNHEYWAKFDGGETPEERKRNKRKKRVAGTVGSAALVLFGPNVGVFATVFGGPVIATQHKIIKHKRKKEGAGGHNH
jgi:hypothetical protein